MSEMSNVRCWVFPHPEASDYKICVQMVDAKGMPLATVGSVDVAPGMEIELRAMFQGIRMGQRYVQAS